MDGASSIYGSDAVAGVTNIIMRTDFDGFEIEGYSRIPDATGGVRNTLNAVWGKNFDRGFIAIGGSFEDREKVTYEDRRWSAGCEKHHEIDENGQIRTEEQFYANDYGMEWDECRLGSLAGLAPPAHMRRYLKALEGSDADYRAVSLEGADQFYDTLYYDHQVTLYENLIGYLENDCGPGGL